MTAALQIRELEDWMAATAASAVELASAIGLGSCSESPSPLLNTEGPSGAYIPLVGVKASVQIGFQSTDEGCRELSKVLLGMSDDEITPDIVKDATCEIANMLAGLVKRRMTNQDTTLRLGLPMFVEGRIHPGPGTTASTRHMMAGNVPLIVVVFQPRE